MAAEGSVKRALKHLFAGAAGTAQESAFLGVGKQLYARLVEGQPENAEELLLGMWQRKLWRSVVAEEYVRAKSDRLLNWARRISRTGDTAIVRLAAESLRTAGLAPRITEGAARTLKKGMKGDYWIASALAMALQSVRQKEIPRRRKAVLRIGTLRWPAYALFEHAVRTTLDSARVQALEFVNIENTAAKREALTQGTIDLMLGTVDEAVVLEAEGTPTLILVLICESCGADAVVGTRRWRKLDDLLLSGRIGVEETGPGHFLVAQLARRANLPISVAQHWRYLQVYDPCTAILQGTLDGAAIWEPWLTMLRRDYSPGLLVSSKDVRPALLIDTLIARRDTQISGEVIHALRRAWRDEVIRYREGNRDALKWVASQLGVDRRTAEGMLTGVTLICPSSTRKQQQRQKEWLKEKWRHCNEVWLYAHVIDRRVAAGRASAGLLR